MGGTASVPSDESNGRKNSEKIVREMEPRAIEMTQNTYDDPAFFEAYSQLSRSVEGLDGAAEWPALRALLPALRGRKVVDLGCGYGWFCRWAVEQGAQTVLGLDVSEKMLARAMNSTADSTITYARADLEKLDLPEAVFDLAYSSLAFHYITDLAGLFRTIHRYRARARARARNSSLSVN
jgi:ubiquinone/menaquinone biosynthesis C-methylase UbiE